MRVDATEDDLRAAAEALKLAAILDDRAPHADKARIAAWAEKIHWHCLQRGDVLDGLQAFYDGPTDRAIQIGDLIHHARNVKRARLDREPDQERDERRTRHDTKATDILSAVSIGPVHTKTERLLKAEIALQCATDKRSAQEAIRAYFAANADAKTQETA